MLGKGHDGLYKAPERVYVTLLSQSISSHHATTISFISDHWQSWVWHGTREARPFSQEAQFLCRLIQYRCIQGTNLASKETALQQKHDCRSWWRKDRHCWVPDQRDLVVCLRIHTLIASAWKLRFSLWEILTYFFPFSFHSFYLISTYLFLLLLLLLFVNYLVSFFSYDECIAIDWNRLLLKFVVETHRYQQVGIFTKAKQRLVTWSTWISFEYYLLAKVWFVPLKTWASEISTGLMCHVFLVLGCHTLVKMWSFLTKWALWGSRWDCWKRKGLTSSLHWDTLESRLTLKSQRASRTSILSLVDTLTPSCIQVSTRRNKVSFLESERASSNFSPMLDGVNCRKLTNSFAPNVDIPISRYRGQQHRC